MRKNIVRGALTCSEFGACGTISHVCNCNRTFQLSCHTHRPLSQLSHAIRLSLHTSKHNMRRARGRDTEHRWEWVNHLGNPGCSLARQSGTSSSLQTIYIACLEIHSICRNGDHHKARRLALQIPCSSISLTLPYTTACKAVVYTGRPLKQPVHLHTTRSISRYKFE